MGRYMKKPISDVLRRKLHLRDLRSYSGDGTPQFKVLLDIIGKAYTDTELLLYFIENGILRLVRGNSSMEDVYNDGVCRILLREAVQPSFGLSMNVVISIVGNEVVHCGIYGSKLNAEYKEISNLDTNAIEVMRSGSDVSGFINIGDIVPIKGLKDMSLLGQSYTGTALVGLCKSWVALEIGSGDDWLVTPVGNVFRFKHSTERSNQGIVGKCIITQKTTMDELIAAMKRDTELLEAEATFARLAQLDMVEYKNTLGNDAGLVPVCANYFTNAKETSAQVIDVLRLLGHELDGEWFKKMKTKALAQEQDREYPDGSMIRVYKSNQAVKHTKEDLTSGGKGIYVYEVFNSKKRVIGYFSFSRNLVSTERLHKSFLERNTIVTGGVSRYITCNYLNMYNKSLMPTTAVVRPFFDRYNNSMLPMQAYEKLWNNSVFADKYLHVMGEGEYLISGETDLSRRVRRYFDDGLLQLNVADIISSNWEGDTVIEELMHRIDKGFGAEEEVKRYLKRLASESLFSLSGEELAIIPELDWTESIKASKSGRNILRARPVKLQGLRQKGLTGYAEVHALAVVISKEVKKGYNTRYFSGAWITLGLRDVEVFEKDSLVSTLQRIKSGEEVCEANPKWAVPLTTNYIEAYFKFRDGLSVLEHFFDIRYSDETVRNKVITFDVKPFDRWRMADKNLKSLYFASGGSTFKCKVCIDLDGQITLLCCPSLSDSTVITNDFGREFNEYQLLVKSKECVNKMLIALVRMSELRFAGTSDVIRIIARLQCEGEQRKDVYMLAINEYMSNGGNMVGKEKASEKTVSDIVGIASEIIEYIGVPVGINNAEYKSLSMNCSLGAALEAQKILNDDLELDDDYDLEDELEVESDDEDSDDELLVEDGIFDDEDELSVEDDEDYEEEKVEAYNDKDKTLGFFYWNSRVITWVMVMNKVCQGDERLKAYANNMETLRNMWMPKYMELGTPEKIEEALKCLWEL